MTEQLEGPSAWTGGSFDMDIDNSRFNCLIPRAAFCIGVEFGRVVQAAANDLPIELQIASENADRCVRYLMEHGYNASYSAHSPGWVVLKGKKGPGLGAPALDSLRGGDGPGGRERGYPQKTDSGPDQGEKEPNNAEIPKNHVTIGLLGVGLGSVDRGFVTPMWTEVLERYEKWCIGVVGKGQVPMSPQEFFVCLCAGFEKAGIRDGRPRHVWEKRVVQHFGVGWLANRFKVMKEQRRTALGL